jgi:hypothetical protein
MRVAKERRIRRKARLARKREIARLLEVVGPDSWRASLVRGFPGDMKLDWLTRWADPVYRDNDLLLIAGSEVSIVLRPLATEEADDQPPEVPEKPHVIR